MVQLYPHTTRPNGPNRYWKLDSGTALTVASLRQHLSDASFTTLKKTRKFRLIELYVRCQRGMLSYEGLSLHELQDLAAQRAVPTGTETTLHSREALMELLEKADNEATFEGFSELPAELRQMVFSHYFNSLVVRETSYKHQPPITLVSRTLREESLPLFYERCNFTIHASSNTRTIPFKIAPDTYAARFIQSIACEDFARIRSLTLEFRNPRAHIQLDFNNKDNPVISAEFYCHQWAIQHNQSCQVTQARDERLLSEVRALAMSILAREGPLKLRVSDIEEMCEMVRRHVSTSKFCSIEGGGDGDLRSSTGDFLLVLHQI